VENFNHFPLPYAVLSMFQAAELLQAKTIGLKKVMASLDLGISRQEISLELAGIAIDKQPLLDWEQLQVIADSENKCFRVQNNSYEEIRFYSESTCRFFSLFPTAEAPALLISGFTMHRFKDISPRRAALEMVNAGAAQKAATVISIELDPGSMEIARSNPWSQELFNHPGISLIAADSSEEISKFPDEYFSVIIHDPPSMSLAGNLYSGTFYRQAWRVLAANGRMFHYIGDPKSALGGQVTRGVVRRLQTAGFRRIIPKPAAYGVLACK
jgi:predicted methyltransferase